MNLKRLFKIYFSPSFVHTLWHELMLKIGYGVKIKLKLTFDCNLRCKDCSVLIPEGERATFDELSLDEWIHIVDTFPVKVRKVILVGGEPFWRKDTVGLINALIDRRIIVKPLTNCCFKRILEVKQSPYFKPLITFHAEANKELFVEIYTKVKNKYRYLLWELDETYQTFPESVHLPRYKTTDAYQYRRKDFIYAPNGDLYHTLGEIYRLRGHYGIR